MKFEKIVCLILAVVFALTLSGCCCIPQLDSSFTGSVESTESMGHIHTYLDATCTEPQTCYCGETKGEALGHNWIEATCISPKTCKVCSVTEGTTVDHEYVDGVCKYCLKQTANITIDGKYYFVQESATGEYTINVYYIDETGMNISSVYFEGKEEDMGYPPELIYKGKTFYSGGVGGPGNEVDIIGEEIVVYEFDDINPKSEIILKFTMNADGNLVVTYSKYPQGYGDVGTVWLKNLD